MLHTAATCGHLACHMEMVKMLLTRGASIDLPTSLGVTALMNTAAYGHPSTLLVLLQHSANPDTPTYRTTMAADRAEDA